MAAPTPDERVAATRVVEGADLAFEFFLNALRLVDGFEPALLTARTGITFDAVADAVSEAQRRGLLECRPDGRWAPTARGRLFLNDLQAIFLTDPAPDRPPVAGGKRSEPV